jgi:GT2 family glycosyltransferase/ubiquinone/menaquinone biosynthesis C-methylase UbiE
MREIIKQFVQVVATTLPLPEPIYEFGSLQVPGQEGFADLRPFFPEKKYIGCDMRPGPGVDLILNLHQIDLPDSTAGTVLIMDTLEHVEFFWKAMDEVYRILKVGGFVVISSVMNFPIHDYPFDYWRFTPEAFRSLLQRFQYRFVEWVGHPQFPHTVVGVGCKGSFDNVSRRRFEQEVGYWKERWSTPAFLASLSQPESMDRPQIDQYYANSRPEVRAIVPPGCTKILDVGCGEGNLGKYLKKERDCEVWGIEIQPQVAEEARRKLDRVYVGDYEKVIFELPADYFDCVIFADVLEHFVDPWKALHDTRRILREGGYIVASVPNVRHWSVVRDLLEGRWEYQRAGILDRTHLRFFTGASLMALFRKNGFLIENVQGTVLQGVQVPPDLIRALRGLGIKAEGLAEEGAIYQYLVVAKKCEVENFTSLIILTRNNLEYTKLCLESIRKYTPEPHEIIVVDNGSTDGTVEYLENQPDVKLIKNGYNLGFALGNNRGLREARGDYIVFLNNDVVVTEGWLTRLLACAKEDDRVGAVGPRSNFVAGPQLVPGVPYGEDLEAMQEFARKWSLEHAGQWENVPRVIGFCMLVRREVIEKIGGFDPVFGTGNFEDDDFCLRLQLAGFTIKIAHDVFVHHFGSKTFQSESIDYRKLMERNWEIFKRKWNLPQHASMERGYVPAMLLRQSFQPEKHVVPLHFAPLPLDGPREKKYLATFSPRVVRFFVERFQADDPVTLVLYYPEGEAYEKVKRCLEEAGYPEEATPDILIHSTPLPERKIPELVAAVDVVLLDGADSPFLPWAVYLGKDIVSVE